SPHGDGGGSQGFFQPGLPRPFGPGTAAVEIKRRNAEFRIGMAGQMRFREQKQKGDPARRRGLVHGRLAHRVQIQFGHYSPAKTEQWAAVAQSIAAASRSVNQPFGADVIRAHYNNSMVNSGGLLVSES